MGVTCLAVRVCGSGRSSWPPSCTWTWSAPWWWCRAAGRSSPPPAGGVCSPAHSQSLPLPPPPGPPPPRLACSPGHSTGPGTSSRAPGHRRRTRRRGRRRRRRSSSYTRLTPSQGPPPSGWNTQSVKRWKYFFQNGINSFCYFMVWSSTISLPQLYVINMFKERRNREWDLLCCVSHLQRGDVTRGQSGFVINLNFQS